MRHRDVEFDVGEDQPGLWRWIIYPETEVGPKVIGEARHRSREAAVAAALAEINDAIERTKRFVRR